MPKLSEQYLLRNVSKYDINLGDLRYKIPAGQTRDLLGKTAHLKVKDILNSKLNGSIGMRLGKTLIEVHTMIELKPPGRVEADPDIVQFPQRIKSNIIIEVGNISEEVDKLSLNEDEEFLKEMEDDISFDKDNAPLVAKKEKKDGTTEDQM